MNQVWSFLYEPLLSRFPLTEAIRVLEQLRKRVMTIKDTEVEAPTFNFWEREGLVVIPHEKGQRKRSLELTEYVWVCLMRDLRSAGVSLEAMKFLQKGLTNDQLFPEILKHLKGHPELAEQMKAADPEGFAKYVEPAMQGVNPLPPHIMDFKLSFLEMLCVWFALNKSHVSLYLLTDGSWFSLVHEPGYQPVWDHYRPLLAQIIYTHVSISAILRHFLKEDVQYASPRLALLAPNEHKVMEILASGEYQKVTVKFKDRKMATVEMKRTDEDREKIVDILTEGNYHEIIIKNRDGLITQIENTTKIKLV